MQVRTKVSRMKHQQWRIEQNMKRDTARADALQGDFDNSNNKKNKTQQQQQQQKPQQQQENSRRKKPTTINNK